MKIPNNNRQSTVVNIMKGLLPILVVTLHTSFDATLHWQDGMEPFIRILLSKLGELAVPAFFLISGYYFFTRLESFNWKEWGAKLFKRVRTLIVPFILWISLAFVAKYVWGIAKSGVAGGFGLASLQDFFISNGGVEYSGTGRIITFLPTFSDGFKTHLVQLMFLCGMLGICCC